MGSGSRCAWGEGEGEGDVGRVTVRFRVRDGVRVRVLWVGCL
jgi:hypothetical protein